MNNIYKIRNTEYINHPIDYDDSSLYPQFQSGLEDYKDKLVNLSNNPKNLSFLRFGDGEYNFLKKIPSGSARPGVRILKKDYSSVEVDKYLMNTKKFDYSQSLIQKAHVKRYKEIFGDSKFDYPIEYTYGLIANRWLFKNLKCKIGIIGGNRKINLIKKLMKNDIYKEYLGIEKFYSYISVPQKYIIDKSEQTLKKINRAMYKSPCDIYLYGIGTGKLYLIPELQKNHKIPKF